MAPRPETASVEHKRASFTAALREAGLRLTPQRLAIVQCLAGDETHPTAQEIHDRLQARFPGIAVATVYNTLSALTRIGVCRQLDMEGPARFDPNVATHHHAVCDRCGAVRDVRAALDESVERAPLPGFRVSRVEKTYRGTCGQCSRSARA